MKITKVEYTLEPGEAPDMAPNDGSYHEDVRFRPDRVEVEIGLFNEFHVRVSGVLVHNDDNTDGQRRYPRACTTVLGWDSRHSESLADWPVVAMRAVQETRAAEHYMDVAGPARSLVEEHAEYIDGPDQPYQPHALAILSAARMLLGHNAAPQEQRRYCALLVVPGENGLETLVDCETHGLIGRIPASQDEYGAAERLFGEHAQSMRRPQPIPRVEGGS